MNLEEAISSLKKELKENPEKLEIEKQVINKFGKLFAFDNIDNITAEQFQEFCDLKNNHHWTISRHKTNLTKDMEQLKKSLKILLDESIPISDRLKRLREHPSPEYQKYLGKAYFSPILLVAHPDKYPVYNDTVKIALEELGIYSDKKSDMWKRYPEVQKIILDLAKKHDLSLWQIDWVWWKVLGEKSYDDLIKFIKEEMQMQENYQPVVIKTLVDLGGQASREQIEEQLHLRNPESDSASMTNTVLQVLLKHKIIRKVEDTEYALNLIEDLSSQKAKEIVNLCQLKIDEFQGKKYKNKIALCWPTDKGQEKIKIFSDFIKDNGKILWGVNWNAPQIKNLDFPIKGYIYFKQSIIAVATITTISEHGETKESDLRLRPTGLGYPEKYSHYLHIGELESVLPFSHKELEMWDPDKKMPDVVQQRVYVRELSKFKTQFRCWIWAVTPENWEIVKQKNIWASKIGQKIRDKVVSGDKVIFYVLGTGQFKGIFEFDGNWYDATKPVWADESNSIIYISQIHLIPLVFGDVIVYDIASELSIFENPDDKRLVNLVLKGAGGYPSNNGKPIPLQDYNKIYQKMESEINYWKISPGENAGDWENQKRLGIIGIGWNEVGDLSTQTFEQIHQKLREIWPSKIAVLSPQFRHFTNIKKGDIILANNGKMKIVGIGRVVGDYQFKPELKHGHAYPVEWYDTTKRDIPIQEGWMQTVAPLMKEKFEELMNNLDDTSNYYIITQNEDSRYDDIPGVQYAYDSDKSHYKNFLVGTNFIVQTKIEKLNYFVGYGKVGKIEKSQGRNPYGNNITKIIAKFSKYTEFTDKKVRTENINEKMLQLAFPNKGARNIPPAMLPITKEIYDEIINTEPILEKLNTFDDEKLPIPTLEDIKEGYEKVSEELLVPEEKIIEIVNALASRRHVLLAGPIGTGKTRLAKIIPEIFWHKIGGYYSEDHTATADWSTQDVIGGIFPKMEDGKPVYDIQNGCVVETVQKNWQDGTEGGKRIASNFPNKNPPYRGTWLIIDEFNRADIDKAFGQLFTALRTRWLKIPTDTKGISYKNLKIPEDYRIIGTLNTADKHFLFQLSDALKSRFAYIEIDIPKKEQMETEIFYALKNAINDLQFDDSESLIVLDHQNKKVNKEKSNPEFYNRIYQAYNFLDSVRVFKKLGTAILKLIYQTMLVGTKMTGDSKSSLDNALISNLIPQIENLSQASIGTIEALHSDSIVKFFRDAYKNPNRQSYVDAFTKTLEYLKSSNVQRLVLEFSNGTLNVDDDGTWQSIQNAYENKKKEFELELNQLKQSMNDLVKSTVI